MERITLKRLRALVVLLFFAAAVTTASAQTVDELAAKGEGIANADPLAAELRNRQPDGPSRRGFDIGMAAAERDTLPGPGKQRIHDSLSPAEQEGFETAVLFSLERNRNSDFAAKGAAIAKADPLVARARTVETDVFYWLGFDIATGIFGDPALGASGNTATGPGSMKIRDSLSSPGQRGFNASVAFHLSRNYKPSSQEVTSIDNSKSNAAHDRAYGDLKDAGTDQVIEVGKDSGRASYIMASLPFIGEVRVRPDTRDVIISFTSTQKTPPLIEIGKVAPAPNPQGILSFPVNSGSFSRFVPGENGKYSLNLGTLGEQLDIGTPYYYIINVFNDNKNNTKRPRDQVTGKFNTLPQSVKVIFTDLRIFPELLDLTHVNHAKYFFFFDTNVNYPTLTTNCWCRADWVYYVPGRSLLGSVKEVYDNNKGTYYKPELVELPKGKISLQGQEIVFENSPDELVIVVQGVQDSDQPARNLNSKQSYTIFAEQVPSIAEHPPLNSPSYLGGSGYYNVARGNFDLSGYHLGPGDSVSIPFTLTSVPLSNSKFDGYLAFEISGHIDVTRH